MCDEIYVAVRKKPTTAVVVEVVVEVVEAVEMRVMFIAMCGRAGVR